MDYIIQWLHHFAIHFGAWVSFIIGVTVYKEGAPRTVKAIKILVVAAVALGAIASLFSSGSHMHYSTYLGLLTK